MNCHFIDNDVISVNYDSMKNRLGVIKIFTNIIKVIFLDIKSLYKNNIKTVSIPSCKLSLNINKFNWSLTNLWSFIWKMLKSAKIEGPQFKDFSNLHTTRFFSPSFMCLAPPQKKKKFKRGAKAQRKPSLNRVIFFSSLKH